MAQKNGRGNYLSQNNNKENVCLGKLHEKFVLFLLTLPFWWLILVKTLYF